MPASSHLFCCILSSFPFIIPFRPVEDDMLLPLAHSTHSSIVFIGFPILQGADQLLQWNPLNSCHTRPHPLWNTLHGSWTWICSHFLCSRSSYFFRILKPFSTPLKSTRWILHSFK
ncbi:hypothetical protein CPB83DRAFT_864243 [Crepidotus variabilis]|uniref:Uncharacterized protein n=1 Tax=Crepidotus variabilis TaxID=179855 RepID=A0A9P6E525_9AGAR|nr:hypothetical protein CPB83DRAFT_864243 [Crepidotus variabilis]